jgi:ABC-type transport system substrate-binding protein
MLKSTTFFCALLFCVACSTNTKQFGDKTVFSYNEPGSVSSLDPAFARNFENIWLINQLYDGLVSFDSNLKITPQLAKSWSIDSTGTHYQFLLKNDVYFHNNKCFPDNKGRKLIAEDVAYSLKRLVDSETASPGRWVLNEIDWKNGGIEAPNDTILNITIKQPTPYFLGLLAMDYCSVVAKEAIVTYGKDFRNKPVGTGPFQLFIWKEGVKLVLHKNEHYFQKNSDGKSLPYLDAVSVSFLKDVNTNFLQFKQGKFDLLSGLDPSYKDEVLQANGELQSKLAETVILYRKPFLKTDYLGFNVELIANTPWGNKNLRKALSAAINREELIKYLRNGVGVATTGFTPSVLLNNYKNTETQKSAQTYLEKAGIDLSTLPELTITTTASAADIAEFVQAQWNKLGINTKVEILPAGMHREGVSEGTIQLFRKNWIADYPDAQNFLNLFYSEAKAPNGPNYFRYENVYFDSLYNTALKTTNDSVRISLYQKMDAFIEEECPVIPLFNDEVIQLVQKNIKGFSNNPMNILDLRNVQKITN